MKIPVGVSARHVHLTQEAFNKLFNKSDLTVMKNINQPDMFAAEETVTIKTSKGEINNVRILGPLRDYNQVEISKTDAYTLGINPKVRRSGDLIDADEVEIVGPYGSILLSCAIIAERHIHICKKDADDLGVSEGDLVDVKIDTLKPGIIKAKWKVSEKAYLELHLDLDDANAFLLNQGDEVEII